MGLFLTPVSMGGRGGAPFLQGKKALQNLPLKVGNEVGGRYVPRGREVFPGKSLFKALFFFFFSFPKRHRNFPFSYGSEETLLRKETISLLL